MQFASDVIQLSRRRLLMLAAGATGVCGRIYGFAADFWNKKAAAEWLADEVHQMLNKSPWAKSVTATIAARGSGGSGTNGKGNGTGNGTGMGGGNNRGGGMGGGGGRGGMGGGGMGSGGMGSGGGMGEGGGTPRAAQQFKGIVRWESAKPIQEAGKTALPDAFAGHYVICVIGFPLPGRGNGSGEGDQSNLSKSALERIKATTSLTPKGKGATKADVAQAVGDALLLGFSQESVKLSPDDKEVAFRTVIGRMAISTKFTFKEMMYHETLAI